MLRGMMFPAATCTGCLFQRLNGIFKPRPYKRNFNALLVLRRACSVGNHKNYTPACQYSHHADRLFISCNQSTLTHSPRRWFIGYNQSMLTQNPRRWYILPTRFYTSDFTEEVVRFGDDTIGRLMETWEKCFIGEGVPESDLSMEAIVAHVLGEKMFHELDSSIKTLVPTEKEKNSIERLCHQRLKRMPIQYIIGEWDFRDMTLIMKPPVFIPRSETEIFVEIITDHYRKAEDLRVLEIGCGSGAISVSLLRAFNKSRVVAFDVLAEAVQLTRENARRYNVQDRLEVYHESVSCKVPHHLERNKLQFDLIVSNPPYIFQEDLSSLEPEVIKFEDSAALNGGKDGADVIYDIIKLASHVLKPGGYIWLETDSRHSEILQDWLESHRELAVRFVSGFVDFTDRPRFCQLQYVGGSE